MGSASGLFPLPDVDRFERVLTRTAAVLRENGFDETGRLPLPGDLRHLLVDAGNVRRYLGRDVASYESSALAPLFYRHFAKLHPDALTLFTAFTLTRTIARSELERVMPSDLVGKLVELEMLVPDGMLVTSRLQASAVGRRIQFHDHYRLLEEDKPEHVFLGRCSTRLARHLEPFVQTSRFGRALDLCTGSGVQAMILARASDEVVGGDVNERALAFARANAAANQVSHATFVRSDLYENIEGTFDVVTANTPFFLLPPGSKALSGFGGHLGMEIGLRLFEGLPSRLNPGGRSFVIASSAILPDGTDLLRERLQGFFGSGGFRIRLIPITLHFPPPHYAEFVRQGVHHSVLYLVDIHRDGTRLDLDTESWPVGIRQAHELQMGLRRLVGWARYRSS